MTFIKNLSTLPKLRAGFLGFAFLFAASIVISGALTPAGAAGPGSGSNPTPSPSPGATPGASPSPSPSPGASPSPTPFATPSPTPVASPSPTPGATPSPTPGATPAPTPGATPSPTPFVTPNEIEADLAGGAINGIVPKGEAEFEIEGGNREFKVRIENVNLPAGSVLRVLVDGTFIGNIAVAANLDRSELRRKTEDGQQVPQINSRTRVVVADASGNTVLAGSFSMNAPAPGPAPSPTPNPFNGELRIESRLAGAAVNGLTPSGHARFRSRDGRRDFNVEVEKVNLPAGTVLGIFVDGVHVSNLVINSTLETEIELESERGQAVPSVTTASTVVVADAQGKTILSGVFNSAPASPVFASNDIDDSTFFVEQQYRDFLSREADDSGLDFWRRQITQCGSTPSCVEGMRINTSGAFFLSVEFQETGYLLYRLHKASYGEMPRRNPFLIDMQEISRGVIVGQTGWEQRLEQNRQALIQAWVVRPEFQARYSATTNEQYVDALLQNAGLGGNQELRDGLIGGMSSGGHTRASILRIVADRAEFKNREKNPAFVLMQYFGYLHRNPDEGPDSDLSGFNFWLQKLNNHGGDFHRAEMVKAFINAGEYRNRFQW